MLTTSDLLSLPYTRDLTAGGIACALHALPHLYNRTGSLVYDQLRRVVAEAMVELAFRRYLSEQGIPFEVRAAAPFTDPDRYDVWLAGQRCDLKSFLISHHDQVTELQHKPQVVLNAPALVASDPHAGEGHAAHDLYLFAFLPACVTTSQSDLQNVIETKQPHYLLHAMPEAWKHPASWTPLGPLTLKSEAEETVTVEIGGQDQGRARRSCQVKLPPRARIDVQTEFFSLNYVHIQSRPPGRIGIHSPARRETHVIGPLDWGNLWIYGTSLLLAGYCPRAEFSRRARFIQAGTRVFQYAQTHVKNLAVPVSELKPLGELFERAKSMTV